MERSPLSQIPKKSRWDQENLCDNKDRKTEHTKARSLNQKVGSSATARRGSPPVSPRALEQASTNIKASEIVVKRSNSKRRSIGASHLLDIFEPPSPQSRDQDPSPQSSDQDPSPQSNNQDLTEVNVSKRRLSDTLESVSRILGAKALQNLFSDRSQFDGTKEQESPISDRPKTEKPNRKPTQLQILTPQQADSYSTWFADEDEGSQRSTFNNLRKGSLELLSLKEENPLEVLQNSALGSPEHIRAAGKIIHSIAQTNEGITSSFCAEKSHMPWVDSMPVTNRTKNRGYSDFGVELLKGDSTHLIGRTTLFLLLLGFLTASTNYLVDETIARSFSLRNYLFMLAQSYYSQMAIYCLYYIFLTLLAILITTKLSYRAIGSGISNMRYILSCEDVQQESQQMLSPRILTAKVLGVICSVGAGMSVGREGPFVHISSCVAFLLVKHVSYFSKIYNHKGLLRQAYDSACAVGVSSTFNAPIGGVLFSIEATSTYYLLSNYWKGFLAAVVGYLLSQTLNVLRKGSEEGQLPYFPGSGDEVDCVYDHFEFPFHLILGLLMGVQGRLYLKYLKWTKKISRVHFKSHSLTMGFIVALISGIVFFTTGEFNKVSPFDSVNDLVSSEELNTEIWGSNRLLALFTFMLSRFLLTPWAISLSYPAGDFLPIFGIGSALGRFYGIFIARYFGISNACFAGYAICGGGALIGATTHTLSSSVLVLEITGHTSYVLPVLLSVVVAVGISKSLGKSVYEYGVEWKKLNFLPKLNKDVHFQMTAKDVMEKNLWYLQKQTNIQSIVYILQRSNFKAYPVVESKRNEIFLGCVSRYDLVQYLYYFFEEQQLESVLFDLLEDEYPEAKCQQSKRLRTFRENNTSTVRRHFSRKHNRRKSEDKDCNGPMDLCKDLLQAKKVKEILLTKLNLEHHESIIIDSSAFRVSEMMSLEQIHVLFELMRCKRVFTTSYGILTGVISRRILIEALQRSQQANAATTGLRKASKSFIVFSSVENFMSEKSVRFQESPIYAVPHEFWLH